MRNVFEWLEIPRVKHALSPIRLAHLTVHQVVHRFVLLLAACSCLLLASGTSLASDAEDAGNPLPDKSGYNLFNPYPP